MSIAGLRKRYRWQTVTLFVYGIVGPTLLPGLLWLLVLLAVSPSLLDDDLPVGFVLVLLALICAALAAYLFVPAVVLGVVIVATMSSANGARHLNTFVRLLGIASCGGLLGYGWGRLVYPSAFQGLSRWVDPHDWAIFVAVLLLIPSALLSLRWPRPAGAISEPQSIVAIAPEDIIDPVAPHSEQGAARHEPIVSYFIRHWRGDHSLLVSWLLNGSLAVIGCILLLQLGATATANIILSAPAAAVLVWLTVGILRSANRHAAGGGSAAWAEAMTAVTIVAAIGGAALMILNTVQHLPRSGSRAGRSDQGEAVESPLDRVHADLTRLSHNAYLYAFPLVFTDVLREVMWTGVPANQWWHQRGLAAKRALTGAVPNADVLDSHAWVLLDSGPVLLEIPAMQNRYHRIAIVDAWGEVFESAEFHSTTAPLTFVVHGPRFARELPSLGKEVRSLTSIARIIVRVAVDDRDADRHAVHKLQNRLKLVPVAASAAGNAADGWTEITADRRYETQAMQRINLMDGTTFFARFASLLPANPPVHGDKALAADAVALGTPTWATRKKTNADQRALFAIQAGTRGALADLRAMGADVNTATDWAAGRGKQWAGASNAERRAHRSWMGLAAALDLETMRLLTCVDESRQPLSGQHRYLLHLEKRQIPIGSGFWSLTLYDDNRNLMDVAAGPRVRGSRTDLVYSPDGSLDIYIQRESPGPRSAANWLAAPPGPFNMILRTYEPSGFSEENWHWPAVRRVTIDLVVGNLPFRATQRDITARFAEFGAVESFRLMQDDEGHNLGFAFVEMPYADAARALFGLDGREIAGRPITVADARFKEVRSEISSWSDPHPHKFEVFLRRPLGRVTCGETVPPLVAMRDIF